MKKIAEFIVDKKNIIFLLFVAIMVYCVWGITQVKVEYSITNYLPSDTDTKQAIDIMDEEFITFGTAKIMVRNISYDDALALHDQIEELNGVKGFEFKNTPDYYKQSCALFSITFEGDGDDPVSVAAYENTLKLLEGRDLLISSSLTDNYADELQRDINFVLILAVVIIVAVLAFTSKSFGEIPVFILTFGVAALLNMGTNFWFGTISFISNSVCVILQLALAIDYAIILCHRFSEEKGEGIDPRDAMASSLAKAIPEIGSSSLTTIAGLLALTTMALGLGADLGLVLAKSILCSMLTVFLFMPCITLFFSKAIDKTTHRSFVPKISFVGKADVKLRYVIPAVFFAAAIVCGYFSFQTQYVYSTNSIDTSRPSSTQIAQRETDEIFGYSNQLAVLVPKGDYSLEKKVIDTVKAHEEVSEALGISNVEITANGQTHYLTDGLNYRQFALLLGTDDAVSANIYRAYAYFSQESTKDGISEVSVFEANKDLYRASILDICDCAFEHDDFISAMLADDEDMLDTYEDLRDTIRDAEDQLIGKNYTRVLFILDCDVGGRQTFEPSFGAVRVRDTYVHFPLVGTADTAYADYTGRDIHKFQYFRVYGHKSFLLRVSDSKRHTDGRNDRLCNRNNKQIPDAQRADRQKDGGYRGAEPVVPHDSYVRFDTRDSGISDRRNSGRPAYRNARRVPRTGRAYLDCVRNDSVARAFGNVR